MFLHLRWWWLLWLMREKLVGKGLRFCWWVWPFVVFLHLFGLTLYVCLYIVISNLTLFWFFDDCLYRRIIITIHLKKKKSWNEIV